MDINKAKANEKVKAKVNHKLKNIYKAKDKVNLTVKVNVSRIMCWVVLLRVDAQA